MPVLQAQIIQSLAQPALAYAGLAAVSIPIAIHLLSRLQRRQQPWAAMRFLYEAFRRHRTRLQLEQWLLLLLRCIVLALLGLALSGPILGGLAQRAGLGTSERWVHLVIDDSLSTQARDADGRQRFETIKARAQALLDELEPTDHVSIWLTSRPAQALVPTSAFVPDDLRRRIESLEPRFGRSELPETLTLLTQSIARLNTPADRTTVVLLSDFSRDALPVDAGTQDLGELGRRARLLVLEPAQSLSNTQIAQMRVRRRPQAGTNRLAMIPVEIQLRRFTPDLRPATSRVRVQLSSGSAAQPLTTAQIDHAWQTGQSQAWVRTELPLETAELRNDMATGDTTRPLSLRASLESDTLAADDDRFASIDYRASWRVAIIASEAGQARSGDQPFSPVTWLTLALSPRFADGQGVFEVTTHQPMSLDPNLVGSVDVAMVTRPDLVTEQGWLMLRDLAERGEVVWVFMPHEQSLLTWTQPLRLALAPHWQFASEVQSFETPGEAATTGWRLSDSASPPEALQLLAADWAALLQPVHVLQRLNVQTSTGADDIWLSMHDGQPLLMHAALGDGHVLFMATALDPTWTNLATKPLFLPLLHETLRTLSATGAQRARLAELVSGDQPELTRAWDGVERLRTPDDRLILLQHNDEGLKPAQPLNQPGIYRADGGMRQFAVNVDADAGDTRTISREELSNWLTAIGPWQWLDVRDLAASLAAQQTTTSFAWPLLWIVLALVLLETTLARWFSHAGVAGRPTLLSLPTRWLRGSGA